MNSKRVRIGRPASDIGEISLRTGGKPGSPGADRKVYADPAARSDDRRMSSQETEGTASGEPSTWIVSIEATEPAAPAKRLAYLTVRAATPMDARNDAITYATRELFRGRGCRVHGVWLYEYAPEPARSRAVDAGT
jgi:hypothetical protein